MTSGLNASPEEEIEVNHEEAHEFWSFAIAASERAK